MGKGIILKEEVGYTPASIKKNIGGNKKDGNKKEIKKNGKQKVNG